MFESANRAFYDNVLIYLNTETQVARGPSWGEWLDIRGMAKSGQKVEAIKMLRAATTQSITHDEVVASYIDATTSFSEFVMLRTKTRPLSLREAKCVIDWLIADEEVFDNAPS